MRIAVLYGGVSNEREVSINTGKSVIKYIDSKKHDVISIDFDGNFRNLINQIEEKNINLVFNALHGSDGENGVLQKELEKNNIAYTGSNSAASNKAMDKNKTKQICLQNNIPTASWGIVDRKNDSYLEILNRIKGNSRNLSIVLKPINEGSSFDLFILDNVFVSSNDISNQFKNYHTQLLKKYDCYMIEEFVKGRELTAGILGNEILPIVEILPKNNFYDYESKYSIGMSEYIVPAKLNDILKEKINCYALKLHNKIGCRHYSRTDFRIDSDNNINVLELNTLPGMTDTSLLPKAAFSDGISYEELVENIIKLATDNE